MGFFQDLQKEFASKSLQIKFRESSFSLKFSIFLLVSNLPATASILNMHHHLARYGCTLCLVQTQLGETARYYPIDNFEMRTPELHEKHLNEIEQNHLRVYRVVKGRSKIFALIPNLTLAAPIDVTHQVYFGVAKVLMQVIAKKTASSCLQLIECAVKTIAVIFFAYLLVIFISFLFDVKKS